MESRPINRAFVADGNARSRSLAWRRKQKVRENVEIENLDLARAEGWYQKDEKFFSSHRAFLPVFRMFDERGLVNEEEEEEEDRPLFFSFQSSTHPP